MVPEKISLATSPMLDSKLIFLIKLGLGHYLVP